MEELNKLWKDQEDFNRNFFPKAIEYPEKSRQTKEFSLCVMSELNELLRSIHWKIHRKQRIKPNREQTKNELTDIFKYWISLCLVWEVSPSEAIQDYWRKSMVCRQRYSEEFVKSLDDTSSKVILCDIDGVLADYYTGYLTWLREVKPMWRDRIGKVMDTPQWLSAQTLHLDEQVWQEMKHLYRTSRGKLKIPVYEGAKEFLEKCRSVGPVILLTSRPIDKYPNLYTDTLEWLSINNLKFDHIWWAKDKREAILENSLSSRILFTVDDDLTYVKEYANLSIPTYWVSRYLTKHRSVSKFVSQIKSVKDIKF